MIATAPIVGGKEIRPFKVNFSQAELDDLKSRLFATRWPEKETVSDQTQRVPLKTIKALAKYWATEFDWRKVEARLNALPQLHASNLPLILALN